MTKPIEIIVGTNRPGSNTGRIARAIQDLYRERNVPVGLMELEHLPPTIYDPRSYSEKPAEFQAWTDRVLASAGLVVVAPEYNGGFPGALKYFIDMLPFPQSFQNRPVCFVGIASGEWGGLRPVEQLQQVFGYRNAFICPYRVFIKGVHRLFDEAGVLTSQDVRDRLGEQVGQFLDFVKRTES